MTEDTRENGETVTLPEVTIIQKSLNYEDMVDVFWNQVHQEGVATLEDVRHFLNVIENVLSFSSFDKEYINKLLNNLLIRASRRRMKLIREDFEYILRLVAACITGKWHYDTWAIFLKKLFLSVTKRSNEDKVEFVPYLSELEDLFYSKLNVDHKDISLIKLVESLQMVGSLFEKSEEKCTSLRASLHSLSESVEKKIDSLFNEYVKRSLLAKEHRELKVKPLKSSKGKKLSKKQAAEYEKKKHETHMILYSLAKERREAENAIKRQVTFSFREPSEMHCFLSMIPPVDMKILLDQSTRPSLIVTGGNTCKSSLTDSDCLDKVFYNLDRIYNVNPSPLIAWDIHSEKMLQMVWRDLDSNFNAHLNQQPNNFLIVGPPCSGKNRLAEHIQNHYNSVYINIDTLLLEKYDEDSDHGKTLRDIFPNVELPVKPQPPEKPKKKIVTRKTKRKVEEKPVEEPEPQSPEETVDVVVPDPSIDKKIRYDILMEKLNSPEITHRGYVLCLNPYSNCEDLLEALSSNLPKYIIRLTCTESESTFRLERITQNEESQIESIEQEINTISEELDVSVNKLKLEYDSLAEKYKKIAQGEEVDDTEEKENDTPEEDEEEYEIDENPIPKKKKLSIEELNSIKKKLLFHQLVAKERLKQRKSIFNYEPLLEPFIIRASQNNYSYIILDATLQKPVDLFEAILQQLCFEVPTPIPYFTPKSLSDGEDGEEPVEAEEEEIIQHLQGKGIYISPIWKRYCPVAYAQGITKVEKSIVLDSEDGEENTTVSVPPCPPGSAVTGSIKFSVVYRNTVYFMHSADAAILFKKNPIPFISQQPITKSNVLILGNCTISSHLKFLEDLNDQFPFYKICSLEYFLANGEKTPAPAEEEEATEEDGGSKKKLKSTEVVYEYPPIEPLDPDTTLKSGCFIVAANYTLNQIEKLFTERIHPSQVIYLETPEPIESEDEQNGEQDVEVEAEGESEEKKEMKMKQEESSDGIPPHFKKYSQYKEHIDSIIAKFEEASIPVTTISSIDKKSFSSVLHQARSSYDFFLPIATVLESEAKLPLGATKMYCPVSLKDKKLLLQGNEEILAVFRNRMYYFQSEVARDLFISDPYFYTSEIKLPPPSFWISGSQLSGKSTVAAFLSQKYNIPIIRLDEAFLEEFADKEGYEIIRELFEKMRYIPPKTKQLNEDGELEEEEEEEIDEEAVAQKKKMDLFNIFCALLSLEPFKSNGYIFDGAPASVDELQVFLRGSFTENSEEDESSKVPQGFCRPLAPSMVIVCTISSKVFIARRLPSLLKETDEKRIQRILTAESKAVEKKMQQKLKRHSEEEEEEEEDPEEQEELPDKAAIIDSLNDIHNEAKEQESSLIDFSKESRIPILVLNCGKAKRTNLNRIISNVHSFTTNLEALLVSSTMITHEEALNSLKAGHSYLNCTYGYEDGVSLERKRESYFTSDINPFLKNNSILVRVTLLDGKKIISNFEISKSLRDIQSYVDNYITATQSSITRYNMRISDQVFEQDGNGFWFVHVPNETLKQNIRRVKSLKRKNQISTLFDYGYTRIASSSIPLEVMLEEWIERVEEPKVKNIRSEEGDEDEEDEEIVEEEEEEEDEEDTTELEPEYEIDESGEPLLDDDGNPILKKKSQPPHLSYPALIQDTIYFFKTEESRTTFLKNPQLYENIHGPSLTYSIPQTYTPHIAVVGDNDNQVEQVSRSVASQIGAEYVSFTDMIQTCLQLSQYSKFALEISQQSFDTIDEAQLALLLNITLNHWQAKTRGFVIGGLPNSISLAKKLTEMGFIFHQVVFLQHGNSKEFEDLKTYFIDEFQNTFEPNISASVWNVSGSVEEMVRSRISNARIYNDLVSQNLPAPIYNIGLRTTEFKKQLSRFKTYCPVSYVDREILVLVDDPLHRYGVEYRGQIYLMNSEKDYNMFIKNPELYTNSRYALPIDLPERVSFISSKHEDEEDEDEIKSTFALHGFDPILLNTIQEDGEPIVVRGSSQFVARYKGNLFRTATAGNLERFLSQPWLYADAQLPSKIPLRKSTYPNLNILQYLEESLQRIVSKALIEVNRMRPLHPCMDVQQSSLEFIALYLRRMNPENNVDLQKRSDEAFNNFVKSCIIAKRLTMKEPVTEAEKRFFTQTMNGYTRGE